MIPNYTLALGDSICQVLRGPEALGGRLSNEALFAMAMKATTAAKVAAAPKAKAEAKAGAGAAGAGAAGASSNQTAPPVWVAEYNLAAQVDRVTTPRWRNALRRWRSRPLRVIIMIITMLLLSVIISVVPLRGHETSTPLL